MNKQRRKYISTALVYLENAMDIIETAKNEEEEAFENLPEGIQCSERGEAMEEGLYTLGEIYDSIESAHTQITEIVEG